VKRRTELSDGIAGRACGGGFPLKISAQPIETLTATEINPELVRRLGSCPMVFAAL